MLIKEVLDKTTQFFKDKKIESPRLDSEILISNALGLKRIDLYLKYEQPLSEPEIEKCREFVKRRSQGEPVAYIIGFKDFYNLQFFVDSRVLVPRPETELLVEFVTSWLNESQISNPQVMDLGCGSGCIGLSIAKNSGSHVILVDKSKDAIDVTNINRTKLFLADQTEVFCSDVMDFNFSDKQVDLIVANPPYIGTDDLVVQDSVKKFEPHMALFSAENGMSDILNWSKQSVTCLKSKGLMMFEIGYNQGHLAQKHFESLNVFHTIKILKDYAGFDRFVIGEK